MKGDMRDKGEEGGLGECKKGEPPVSAIVLMVDQEGAMKGPGEDGQPNQQGKLKLARCGNKF